MTAARQRQLRALPPELAQCRDYGHSWRGYTAKRLTRYRFESILRCSRCETLRVRVLTDSGLIVSNHYRYPAEYLITGLGRLTAEDRGSIRLASLLHDLEGTP